MARNAVTTFCSVLILVFLNAQLTSGQVLEKLIGTNRVDTEFVPDDAFAGLAIFPKSLAEDPDFDLLPREILTAWGKKELGFDPMLIKQATFVLNKMEQFDQLPQWAAILHFEEMQGLAGGLINRLEEKKVGGKVVFSGKSQGTPSFLIYDEATMFVGDEALFDEMITSKRQGRLAGLMKQASLRGDLVAFVDLKSVRPMLNQAVEMLPTMLPPAVGDLKQLPNMIDAIELGISMDGRVKTEVVMHSADSEVASEATEIIRSSVEFGLEFGIGVLAAQMDFNDPVQESFVEYAQRVGEEFKSQLQPKLNGKRMSLSLDQELAVVPIIVGLALPAVQQSRTSARRVASMNNLRQLNLAASNYHSIHDHFPTQASYDKNGRPLLSWRVHILPFIEEIELYEKFRLDEPWDSQHNRKLIAQMPHFFNSPLVASESGKTVYLGVAGKGMMFNGQEKIALRQVLDGLSNTVFLVEVSPDRAVEWTRPLDYRVNPNNPLDGLGQVNLGGFIVALADGSVSFIDNNIDPESWLKLLTRAGGEIVSPYDR